MTDVPYTGVRSRTHIVVGTVAVHITLTAAYRGKHAPGTRITGVTGAAVPIITDDGSSPTAAVRTLIVFGTGVSIVTEILIMYVLTATNRITNVIGTYVAIIAVNYTTCQAGSSSVTGFCPITEHTIRAVASCLFILTVGVTAISIYGITIITFLP